MSWNIPDYGLTAQQLEEKYEKRGAHPQYWWDDFRKAFPRQASNDAAYWAWVKFKLQKEQDELDRSSPYNHNSEE